MIYMGFYTILHQTQQCIWEKLKKKRKAEAFKMILKLASPSFGHVIFSVLADDTPTWI